MVDGFTIDRCWGIIGVDADRSSQAASTKTIKKPVLIDYLWATTPMVGQPITHNLKINPVHQNQQSQPSTSSIPY